MDEHLDDTEPTVTNGTEYSVAPPRPPAPPMPPMPPSQPAAEDAQSQGTEDVQVPLEPAMDEASARDVSDEEPRSPSDEVHDGDGEGEANGGVSASPDGVHEAPDHRRPKSVVAIGLVCSLLGGLIGGGIVAATTGSSSNGASSVAFVSVHDGASPAAILPSGESIPTLVHDVLPSVVSIDSSGGGSEDQGTGMIISQSGLVLTNNHVIANAASGGVITVTQSGSTTALPAALIGRDPSNDVALLRIVNTSGLHPVTFARSSGVEVGTAVVAIGNALGLAAGTPTVTSGIVSALGRSVTASDSSGGSSETLTNMIQTDAAINPGNSGGPLLNARGEVIGMNTAVAGSTSDGTSAQNIGFAIPSDHLTTLITQLEKHGTTPAHEKAFLGVYLISMTPQLQQQYGFTVSAGAIVTDVNPGGPADKAGIVQGDVIVKANGTPTPTADALGNIIAALKPGDRIRLTVNSNGHDHVVVATLGVKS